ncbi:hypothetical protein A0H81_02826 [Grifola frondosa]|uniref:Uncharacterized protein n=1 Tax=Grifola frondosa TaxID=5627 RepID=A0A1C7MQI7_GRIFR|nr:hypothetical protein A0H81_02826 [Grifola frondosa]
MIQRSSRIKPRMALSSDAPIHFCVFLHLAHDIKEHNVPSALFVFMLGVEEKPAVTVIVSVLNSSAVYMGETSRSTPMPGTPNYDTMINADMHYDWGTHVSYWSTQRTMQLLVDTIIAHYFDEQKHKLGLPKSQKSIWQINVWSVHQSDEFWTWLQDLTTFYSDWLHSHLPSL